MTGGSILDVLVFLTVTVPFVCITLCLFLYRKPLTRVLESGRIRLKKGDAELAVDSSVQTGGQSGGEVAQSLKPGSEETPLPSAIPSQEEGESREPNWRFKMMKARYTRDLGALGKAYQERVKRAGTELEKLELEAEYTAYCYELGDTSAFDRLMALVPKTVGSVHVTVLRHIAQCYRLAGEYSEAAAAYEEIRPTGGQERAKWLDDVENMAVCLDEAGHRDKAIETLISELPLCSGPGERAKVFLALASLYGKHGDPENRVLALEKASEGRANDGDLRFKVAFEYAELGSPHAAVYHYRAAVLFGKGGASNNNLAIILEGLGLRLEANRLYRVGAEKGSTTSACNLASNLIAAALGMEAEEVLNKASKQDTVDPRVYSHVERLKKLREREKAKIEEVDLVGRKQREFYAAYAGVLFSGGGDADLQGIWQSGIRKLTLRISGGTLSVIGLDSELTGKVHGGAAAVGPGVGERARLYLTQDGQLSVMVLGGSQPTFLTLTRST